MMEKQIRKSKNAMYKYNLNNEYELTQKLLKYIYERIVANKDEIQKLLKLNNRSTSYNKFIESIKDVVEGKIEYKSDVNIKKREDKFVSAKYQTAIGVVAVECYDVIECVKYMIEAIKTRNAIIISDIEYNDMDDKHLILLIIKEAIIKFGLDENLIGILPYEECDYTKCDKVIFTYENKDRKNIEKEHTNKKYIYLENEDFRNEANKELEYELKKGENVELLEGNEEEILNKINKEISKGVVIYTKDKKLAYKFLTLVNSKNVFINASLENVENVEISQNDMLITKKIIYELVEM